MVGNLTTASTSLRGFTTVLLGYYCADRVLEKDEDQTPLDVFLRVEQLVNYSRAFNRDTDFRGNERVKKRLEDSNRVTLSAEPRHQILGDQKTYGLWGLYSVASRTSGFLLPDRPSLTPNTAEFVEREYIHLIKRSCPGGVGTLIDTVAPPRKDVDLKGKAGALAHLLASIHGPHLTAAEVAVYQRSLVDGGDEQNTGGHQRQLGELLGQIETEDFAMSDLQRVIRLAEKQKLNDLAARLHSIQRLEGVIVAAANLFAFLLRCDGRLMDDVERDVRSVWGPTLKTLTAATAEAIEHEIQHIAHAPESAASLGHFARVSAAGNWRAAADGLIDFNTEIMKRRGGAPWIRCEKSTLRVDYREDGADLAAPAALESPWQNTYFINALHGIKRTLTSH